MIGILESSLPLVIGCLAAAAIVVLLAVQIARRWLEGTWLITHAEPEEARPGQAPPAGAAAR